jgi:hypothetical protein
MIHCVKLADVRLWLTSLGMKLDFKRGPTEYWRKAERVVMLPPGNINDDIPEEVLLSALLEAGLNPPNFTTHWCD